MKFKQLCGSVEKAFYKTCFKIRKHTPEICEVAGIVGVVTASVMACKATLKLPEKTEEFEENLDLARNVEENKGRAVTHAYVLYGIDILKIYWPSLVIGGASIGSICYSGHVYRGRNASLTAAYAAINTGFKEYRDRVAERFGEDVEKQILLNTKEETIKEKETLEDGTTKTVKKKMHVVDPECVDGVPYTRIFDANNPCFSSDPEINIVMIHQVQEFFQGKLERRFHKTGVGYVFLNEIFENLHYKPTEEGQIIGWVKTSEDDGVYIDFGLDEKWRTDVSDFAQGLRDNLILNFNVTGNVLEALA